VRLRVLVFDESTKCVKANLEAPRHYEHARMDVGLGDEAA
jgi:hypothetical protein